MSVKYGKFELPQEISVELDPRQPHLARYIAEPFERGFGHTMGNALRRVLFTSLETVGIVSVRIEGIPHEYMSIEGVIEDMTNIILNFKSALLRKLPMDDLHGIRDMRMLSNIVEVTQEDLDQNDGVYSVTFGDVVKSDIFEVVNPDLHLFTVTKPFRKQIDLRVSFGRGYVPSERHFIRDKVIDEIIIDTAFSPVRLFNYYVENTRVGQDTDLDKLIIEITTDGRIMPNEALSFSAQIVAKHLNIFRDVEKYVLSFDEHSDDSESDFTELMDKLSLGIDEIELSVRSANCLVGADIDTLGELVTIPERRMLEFKNFGKKSLSEINGKLKGMNLSLGMDLVRYGITVENVKERMKQYREEKKKKNESSNFEQSR